MTTDGKEDKDSAGTEENEDECLVLNGIQGEESLAAPPAATQTLTSTMSISSRRGDQTTTGKGGKGKEREGRNDDEHGTNETQKIQMETMGIETTFTGDGNNSKKKKKIALFFGYNGDGYQGMQRNPGAKTIEDDLESAIV